MPHYFGVVLLAVAAGARRDDPPCVQVAVFKDSSSGSSWFLQQMNGLRGVTLKNELLVSRTASHSAAAKTSLVSSGLARDCAANAQTLTGFNLNPHHAIGVRWSDVRNARPHARAVVWDRTNWVKKVASAILFEQKGCHRHNARTYAHAKRCRAARAEVEPREFLARVRGEACDSAHLYAAAATMAGEGGAVVSATYEAFRGDTKGELTRLLTALGLDPKEALAASRKAPRTLKRTPEDLRRSLVNFKELAKALARWSPPGCDLEKMLLDRKGSTPFKCDARHACDHLKRLDGACRSGPGPC